MLRPKKVGTLPTGNGKDEVKQTNEIKFAPILLDTLDIDGKDITSDALHTQTEFSDYIVIKRNAHYFLCVKKNQPTLFADIDYYFSNEQRQADHEDEVSIEHGRVEIRRIWVTTELNGYVKFPHVAQVYKIEREIMDKKTGKISLEIAYGITSRKPEDAGAKTILHKVRGHWSVEAYHYIIDWVYDEDRSTIRIGHGPVNITRLRRFAIGLIKSKRIKNVSKQTRALNRNIRAVLDYFKMTKNSQKDCRA